MLHVALLSAAIAATHVSSTVDESPIQRCFATMDGAVYHGDPSDRATLRAGIRACKDGTIAAQRIRVSIAQGPERLFIIARLLDRSAILSYMGLDDADAALEDVRQANLFFRVAAGLPDQSADFHAAALANVELTNLQLQTLRTDIASRAATGAASVAMRPRRQRIKPYQSHDQISSR